uniref:Secreted protein n=1 Tax=Steinernema glaseri TaxID=37863 RepID=A0A1I7Z3K2_9BILA
MYYYWLSFFCVVFIVAIIMAIARRARMQRRHCHQHHCTERTDVYVVTCNVEQSPSAFPASTAPPYQSPQQGVAPTPNPFQLPNYAQYENPPPGYSVPANNSQSLSDPRLK